MSAPLLLLRQIRDVMARPAGAQARLDQVVYAIAEGFSCEVCSVYLLRAGDILELFANIGLKPGAVHLTRLGVGEGLVGEIAATAAPLNLADARNHPQFVYKPETGEEMYRSFIGAPMLQGGKVIGVLVVQGKQAKNYSDDQLEVLQTVAMVLAELTVAGGLVDRQEIKATGPAMLSQQLSGISLSPGLAKAQAVLHHPAPVVVSMVASDTAQEKERFERALDALKMSFSRFLAASDFTEGEEERDLLEAYLMFTQDQGWIRRVSEAIDAGLTAEAAVRKVQEQLRVRMSQTASAFIKERMHDLEDFSNRLVRQLVGEAMPAPLPLPERFVLVARSLGPAELLDYDHTRLAGLVLEEGAATSHTAIIARALDIPAVSRIADAIEIIQTGDMVAVDGDAAEVFVRPTDEMEQAIEEHLRQKKARSAGYEALRDEPAVTLDGVRISLNINAGLLIDPHVLREEGVDGIGLYRTELPYMTSHHFPDVETQRQIYSRIYEHAGSKRVVFRSFDIGGDKTVPYLHTDPEENPAMGWRATRIGLDRPAILRRQFRAFLGAAAERELSLMFPFIATVEEFDATRALLGLEIARARRLASGLPLTLRIGAMIEVPAILWQLPELLARVDFVSVGSNDLLQFLFACDRGTPGMTHRYDALSPIVLHVVRLIARESARAGGDAGFCGEMARKPLDAMALIGTGIRNLSVPASAVGPLKAMIRSLDCAKASAYVNYLCEMPGGSIRGRLADYARDHGVVI